MATLILALVVLLVPLSNTFNTVGYMPEWRYEGADFDRLCQHLTHLILFSVEMTPKGDIIALDRLPRPELLMLTTEYMEFLPRSSKQL